jgi:hypothetical protein
VLGSFVVSARRFDAPFGAPRFDGFFAVLFAALFAALFVVLFAALFVVRRSDASVDAPRRVVVRFVADVTAPALRVFRPAFGSTSRFTRRPRSRSPGRDDT